MKLSCTAREAEVRGSDIPIDCIQLLHRHSHDTRTALDKKTYTQPKLQDLPEGYLWVDDMLILREGCTYEKGRLREEPIWR